MKTFSSMLNMAVAIFLLVFLFAPAVHAANSKGESHQKLYLAAASEHSKSKVPIKEPKTFTINKKIPGKKHKDPLSPELAFEGVKKRLATDKSGPGAEFVSEIFSSPRLEFATDGIARYFRHQESRLNYGQFLEERAIKKARDYMAAHKDTLIAARKAYGVDPEIITAILLVETRLGEYTGNQKVINILATMASLSDPKVREAFWDAIPKENRISKDAYEKKAKSKADWAYQELKALLVYSRSQGFDPFDIHGSYAGALGLAQFMPSNILKLGKDGNGDGRIDLFDHKDAVFSIAAYLKYYGWKPGIDRAKARKVIYHYNHSSYYVDTILGVAKLLKKKQDKKS